MNTHIHVSGLSYFCTDDQLRQAFTPFGGVMLAKVLRDECGHSLGVGIVHMASSEDVERVFSAHQLFEVSGSRMDLWEAEEPKDSQYEWIVVRDLQDSIVARTGHGKRQKALQPLTAFMRRLLHTLVPSFRTVGH